MAVGFDFKKTININKCRKIDKNARGVFVWGFRSSGRGLLSTSKIEIPGYSEKEL
jgi:hypothetical protein